MLAIAELATVQHLMIGLGMRLKSVSVRSWRFCTIL